MSKSAKKIPYVVVSSKLKNSLDRGHPWIYRDAVERAAGNLTSGTWVRVQCANLQFFGLWDNESPIAVRIFSSKHKPNKVWVKDKVRQAWDLRASLRTPAAQISAYRWLYGEADGLPGITVDLYGDVVCDKRWAVLRTYAESLARITPWILASLHEVTALEGILGRDNEDGRATKLLDGRLPDSQLVIKEHGLKFEVDLIHGQKTGFFLDQRQNRRTIERWSKGMRVLNLFSYTGGFSLYAARGGATRVISVDSARAAMATAERNFPINGFDPARHEFIVADVFALLENYHAEGRRFDMIVVDPPSFARSKAQLSSALHAYRKLNTLALCCLAPDGLLASSSCTSQVSPDAFRAMLSEAASLAKRRLLILHDAGQPLDHPVPAHFPEGRYLKFILARADTIR